MEVFPGPDGFRAPLMLLISPTTLKRPCSMAGCKGTGLTCLAITSTCLRNRWK